MARRARQRGGGSRPARFDQRPDLAAQIAAVETQILVHRIEHRGGTRLRRQRKQRRLRHLQQRTQMPAPAQRPARRHGRQAFDPGAAQRLQQQRFRLILGVMRRQQAFAGPQLGREGRIASLARRRLERHPRRRLDGDGNDGQGNLQWAAQGRAGFAKRRSGGLHAMIDMHRAQAQAAQRCRPSRPRPPTMPPNPRRRSRRSPIPWRLAECGGRAPRAALPRKSYASWKAPKPRRRACRASSNCVTG